LRLRTGLALTALTGLALAPTAAASSGDQLTGGGISSFGTTFGFTAHDGPNGPSGHATFKNKSEAPPQADRKGHVICLKVSGNRAVFAVQDPDERPGGGVLIKQFYVEDNGTGGSKSPKDELTEVEYDNCASAADRQAFPITNGNIEVRDR
jgi:hypothetical protein